jgi:hypothetical protein
MTIVSTKDFNANQDKYFDLALNDQVVIQREGKMFLIRNFSLDDEPEVIFEPDDDFYRSIPIETVRDNIIGYIHKKHLT